MHSDQVPPSTSSIIFRLEPHQPGMGEIKRDGDAGHVGRAEPLARHPGVRPQPDVPRFEFFLESVEATFEPGAVDGNPQAAEALLEQLFIR